jgi:hypothetical protein
MRTARCVGRRLNHRGEASFKSDGLQINSALGLSCKDVGVVGKERREELSPLISACLGTSRDRSCLMRLPVIRAKSNQNLPLKLF